MISTVTKELNSVGKSFLSDKYLSAITHIIVSQVSPVIPCNQNFEVLFLCFSGFMVCVSFTCTTKYQIGNFYEGAAAIIVVSHRSTLSQVTTMNIYYRSMSG
jgi:hypothetical protein